MKDSKFRIINNIEDKDAYKYIVNNLGKEKEFYCRSAKIKNNIFVYANHYLTKDNYIAIAIKIKVEDNKDANINGEIKLNKLDSLINELNNPMITTMYVSKNNFLYI